MKKALLLIAILISIGSKAQYQSILVDSSHWNVYNDIVGFGILISYTDSLYLGDTTSIKGTKYTEVISDYLGQQFSDTIYGYVREDTSQGKAWFLKDSTSVENLIYDLTLVKGDTFRIIDSLLIPQILEFSVDTTYTLNSRKHIKLSTIGSEFYVMYVNGSGLFSQFNYDSLLLIEGIGSIRGFDNRINSSAQPFFIGNSDRLLCAYQKGVRVFRHSLDSTIKDFQDCNYDFTVGLKNQTVKQQQIKLFPNPTKEQLNVAIDGYEIESIKIVDVVGRKQQYDVQIQNKSSTILDIGQLKAGTYFISLQDKNGGISVSRFIKTGD